MSGKKDLEKNKQKTQKTHDEDKSDGNEGGNPFTSSSHAVEEADRMDIAGTQEGVRQHDDTSHVGQEAYDEDAHSEHETLKFQVHALEQENNKLKDELLRNRAELENSKKRLSKHYEEVSQNKTKQLLLDIITLLDDFERAFESMSSAESTDSTDNTGDVTSMIEGIKMIESQFIKTLETKWNVCRYSSMDSEFNPTLHEAMMTEVVGTFAHPTVVAEFSKGYMCNDKVLRPAKVKVAMPE